MAWMKGRVLLAVCILSFSVSAFSSEPELGSSVKGDINWLYHGNAKRRTEAAERLVAAGPRVIPLLLPVICDRTKPRFKEAWPIAAKILGEMKAKAAAPCLVDLLMYEYPPMGPVIMKTDETLMGVDPAFAALVRIGEPAVPAIRAHLPFLGPEAAIMALRVLRVINTPSAREAAETYIKTLQHQLRFAGQVLEDFGK